MIAIKNSESTNPANSTVSADSFLSVSGVTKSFGKTSVLNDVSLDVARGEFVCILGPSGCGKTTLLRAIAGLETADRGTVRIGGVDMTKTPTAGRGIGIVFQSYALFPNLTALQNVRFGMRQKKLGQDEVKERARRLLDLVGLADCSAKYPGQLSGGQQQRVALARALAPEPSILLLDEPLSALDAKVRQSLRRQVRRLQQKMGITAVMVTHDQEEALTMSDRIVVMSRGHLAQFASPEEIYRLPSPPFVPAVMGAMKFLMGWRLREGVAKCGNVTMRVSSEVTDVSATATLAIRPEDVQVQRNVFPEENTFIAKVVDMEFRGSGYCVALDGLTAGKTGGMALEALVPPLQVSRMGLKTGDCVKVKLPRERLVCFLDGASRRMPALHDAGVLT